MKNGPPCEGGPGIKANKIKFRAAEDSASESQPQALSEMLVGTYDRMTPPDRAWLEGQGVPSLAIHTYPGPIGVGEDGAFIHPVYAEVAYSDIVGAVAWLRRDPSQFAIVAGGAGDTVVVQDDVLGLGQHFLFNSVDRRGSLAVVTSPLEWLKRYGACFCPLRWPDAAVELLHLSRIIAEPPEFGRELRRRIENIRPRMPQIVVRSI